MIPSAPFRFQLLFSELWNKQYWSQEHHSFGSHQAKTLLFIERVCGPERAIPGVLAGNRGKRAPLGHATGGTEKAFQVKYFLNESESCHERGEQEPRKQANANQEGK